jgi:hypothetical protein
VTLGTLRQSGRAGSDKVAFSGRLKGKALARGTYRFSLTATDAGGSATSRASTIAFTVVRAKKSKS